MLQAGGRGWEQAEVDNREGVEVLDSILSYKFNKLGVSPAPILAVHLG